MAIELSPSKIKAFQKELERRQKEEALRYWNQGDKRHLKQIEVIKRPERFLGVFGGNRCLSGDVKVLCPDGSKKNISDIRVGDRVFAYDTSSGQAFPSKVIRKYQNGIKPVYSFEFGRYKTSVTLACTEDHKVWTETESHRVVKKRAVGNISPRRTAAIRSVGSNYGEKEPRALLLGLLLGDGYLNGSGIQFTCADPGLIEEIRGYVEQLGYYISGPRNDIQYFIHSPLVSNGVRDSSNGRFTEESRYVSQLRLFLEELGLWGTKSRTKFIPKEVWDWDTESISRLVAGYISADGCVSISEGKYVHVSISSSNWDMLNQTKELMEVRLGIYGSTIIYDGRHTYNITFGTYEALEKLSQIGIPGRKGRKLLQLLNVPKRKESRSSRLPYRGSEYVGMRETYDIEVDHPDHLFLVEGGLVVSNSGKTAVGAMATVLEALGELAEPYIQDWKDEDKEWWYANYNTSRQKNIWCATVNWDVQRDILQPEFFKWLPKPVRERSVEANRRKGVVDFIELPNGTMVTFKSYDSGKDAFQGASLDQAWLDEEPELGIWAEIKQRVMDKKGKVILTMTPLKGLTWAYTEIYLNEIKDKEVFSIHFTWDDNPWLDKGEIARLESSMSEDELAARKYGEFMAAGGTVMSKSNIMERKREVEPPHARMSWSDEGRFVLSPDGPLEIYDLPEKGRYYIVGADVAEGLPSGDNSVACVIDSTTGTQVAEYAFQLDTTTFADQLAWIGKFYNTALVAPERNNNGHAVLQRLDREIMYPSVYKHKGDGRLGWPQNMKTRPIVISYLQDFARELPEAFNSVHILNEGLTFVRNSRGKPEAAGKGRAGGNKDDRLFAFGIAQAVRDMYGPPLEPIKPEHSKQKKKKNPTDPWIDKDGDEDAEDGRFVNWDPEAFVNFPMFGEEDEPW